MCTSFVFNGDDIIVGFNWDFKKEVLVKVKARADMVYAVFSYDGRWTMPCGVHRDGQFGNMLMVPAPKSENLSSFGTQLIGSFVEDYLSGKMTFDSAIEILSTRDIVNDPTISLHTQLSDKQGRILIIEPGRGYKVLEDRRYNVLTNFSYFEPMATKDDQFSGYQRYIDVSNVLEHADDSFSVEDAFKLLKDVANHGNWPTRVSMVYSVHQNKVYWVTEGDFENIQSHQF